MYADLTNDGIAVNTDKDSIVIVRALDNFRGGRTLDVTGFTPTVIQAGHVVIKETSSGNYKPMPIVGSAYDALPTGHTYAGILQASVLTKRAFGSILTNGTVNPNATPYSMTSILAAFKTAVPQIEFRAD